jgi:hypothetical protein
MFSQPSTIAAARTSFTGLLGSYVHGIWDRSCNYLQSMVVNPAQARNNFHAINLLEGTVMR